jgi:hypothetical protein
MDSSSDGSTQHYKMAMFATVLGGNGTDNIASQNDSVLLRLHLRLPTNG